MANKTYIILSTRILDANIIAQAAFNNISIDEYNFISIEKNYSTETYEGIVHLAQQKSSVIFTSTNAVETLIDILPDKTHIPQWNIYCTGGATFSLIKKYWPYENIARTAQNASVLAELIIADNQKKITFFCGNRRREELPYLLEKHQIKVTEYPIYNTVLNSIKTDKHYDAILIFSPSAAESFFSTNTVNHKTVFFAIGNTSAKEIRKYCNNKIIVSDFPSKNKMFEQVIKLINEDTLCNQ